jgi:hypothetical protein
MILLRESSHTVAADIIAPGEEERNPGFRNVERTPSAQTFLKTKLDGIGRMELMMEIGDWIKTRKLCEVVPELIEGGEWANGTPNEKVKKREGILMAPCF